MTFALEATLGLIHFYSAHSAVEQLSDIRAQRWLAARLPGAMERIEPHIYFPSPFGLTFDTGFLGEPAWKDHPVIVEGLARRLAHERTALVGYERGETLVGYGTFGVPHDADAIIDWLRALPEIDPRMMDKLPLVTWEQALQHARRWHERLAARREEGLAGDAGTVDRTPVPSMPGWCWLHLVTRLALDNEGAVQGHCVGGGGYDDLTWMNGSRPDAWDADKGIWSLRDPTGRSRVTVEIGFDGIVQAQGPKNTRPEEETAPAFEALLARFVKPAFPFSVPHWLARAEDGTTTWRRPDAGTATFRPLRARHVMVDEVDQEDSWRDLITSELITSEDIERVRGYRGVVGFVTAIDTAVQMTVRSASDFVAAVGRMCGETGPDLTVAEWIRRHAPVGGIEPDPEPARAPAFVPPGRRDLHRPEPWYRAQERQQAWRTPR